MYDTAISLHLAKLGQSLKSIILISPFEVITQSPPYISYIRKKSFYTFLFIFRTSSMRNWIYRHNHRNEKTL